MALCGLVKSKIHCARAFTQLLKSTSLQRLCLYEQNSRVCLPIQYTQQRDFRKKIDVSHLKPLKFDYAEDIESQVSLDPKAILFKYKDIAEIQNLPEHIKKMFTVEFASSKERLEHRSMEVQDIVGKVTGPGLYLEKQIAYLTVKIRNLVPYIIGTRQNKKHKSYLIERIAKRKKLLSYLRRLDYDRYLWILNLLKLRYSVSEADYPLTMTKRVVTHDKKRKLEIYKALEDEQNKRLGEIKTKVEKEKATYLKDKQNILDEIDKDIEKYGLDKIQVLKEYENFVKSRQEQAKKLMQTDKKKIPPGKKFKEYEEEKKKRLEKESRVV